MIPGIYSAATAMDRASQRHELIAQNLAHVNMPGYRRVTLEQQPFEAALSEAQQDRMAFYSLGTTSTGPSVDFTPGQFEATGQPLDLAINGDGFFVIETPDERLYTRNGTFHLNQDGRLVTADGYPVVSDSGDLRLPPNASLSQLSVEANGTVSVDGVQLGAIKVVRFRDPQALVSRGVTLFQAPPEVTPENTDATILQGMREHANVQPVRELVDMIAASRAHEAAKKAMNTLTSAIENHTNLRG